MVKFNCSWCKKELDTSVDRYYPAIPALCGACGDVRCANARAEAKCKGICTCCKIDPAEEGCEDMCKDCWRDYVKMVCDEQCYPI